VGFCGSVVKYSIICCVFQGSATGFLSDLLIGLSCFFVFLLCVCGVGCGIPDEAHNLFIMIRVGLRLH
jgi:hypothetical protein